MPVILVHSDVGMNSALTGENTWKNAYAVYNPLSVFA